MFDLRTWLISLAGASSLLPLLCLARRFLISCFHTVVHYVFPCLPRHNQRVFVCTLLP